MGRNGKPEIQNLTTAMTVYKEKGGDVAYFTQGFGAPENASCMIQ